MLVLTDSSFPVFPLSVAADGSAAYKSLHAFQGHPRTLACVCD